MGADPDKLEALPSCLQACLGSSEADARDCIRHVLAGRRITVFENLDERDADERHRVLVEAGARVERRTFIHPDPCDVVLVNVGSDRIRVLQAICEALGGGLDRALALLDAPPVPILLGIHRKQAERLQAELEGAGAEARVTPSGGDAP